MHTTVISELFKKIYFYDFTLTFQKTERGLNAIFYKRHNCIYSSKKMGLSICIIAKDEMHEVGTVKHLESYCTWDEHVNWLFPHLISSSAENSSCKDCISSSFLCITSTLSSKQAFSYNCKIQMFFNRWLWWMSRIYHTFSLKD